MAALENDPNTWEAIMRFLKSLAESLASFSAFTVPALAGAVIGVLRRDRRRKGKRLLVSSIVMSWIVGCGLTPLFAHVFGVPDGVASSLAFFLGVWGLEGLDILWTAFKSKVGENNSGTPPPDDV